MFQKCPGATGQRHWGTAHAGVQGNLIDPHGKQSRGREDTQNTANTRSGDGHLSWARTQNGAGQNANQGRPCWDPTGTPERRGIPTLTQTSPPRPRKCSPVACVWPRVTLRDAAGLVQDGPLAEQELGHQRGAGSRAGSTRPVSPRPVLPQLQMRVCSPCRLDMRVETQQADGAFLAWGNTHSVRRLREPPGAGGVSPSVTHGARASLHWQSARPGGHDDGQRRPSSPGRQVSGQSIDCWPA